MLTKIKSIKRNNNSFYNQADLFFFFYWLENFEKVTITSRKLKSSFTLSKGYLPFTGKFALKNLITEIILYQNYHFCSFFSFSFLNIRLGLWCLRPLSTIFHLYDGGQFYSWRKSEYLEKTTDLPQVTDNLHHIMLYQVFFNINFSVLVTARSNLSMRETFACSMIKNLHINWPYSRKFSPISDNFYIQHYLPC